MFNFLKKEAKFVLKFAIVLITSWIFIYNLFSFVVSNRHPLKTILVNPVASYDWKMKAQVGLFYEYTKFINEQTPRNALILHPKQQSRWPKISNQGYTRYFVYPRNLVAENQDEEEKKEITHIFIIGRKDLDSGDDQDQWPEVKIRARRLIYMPEFPGGEVTILEKDYNPQDEINDRWGIIELEK